MAGDGAFDPLVSQIYHAAGHGGSCCVRTRDGSLEEGSWLALLAEAEAIATRLAGVVPPGSVIALLSAPSMEMLSFLFAAWRAGMTVSIVGPPVTARGYLEPFKAIVDERLLAVDARAVFCSEEYADHASTIAVQSYRFSEIRQLRPGLIGAQRSPFRVVQFTSGTTGTPRPAWLTSDNLVANIRGIQQRLGLEPLDHLFSWLPLYHDMGLVGFVTVAAALGASLTLFDTRLYRRSPREWLPAVAAARATVIGAPQFAYSVAARLGVSGSVDLSRVRLAFNGAEPVDPRSTRSFLDVYSAAGFAEEAMLPVYGMAETTVATTVPAPGYGLRTAEPTVTEIAASKPRSFVLVGHAVDSVELKILRDGELAATGEIGEIHVRGDALASGATIDSALITDGWLPTGDLGFFAHGGDVAVCGRLKECIAVSGRTIFPTEVERLVASIPGVRAGCVVAFDASAAARSRVVLVVEAAEATGALADAIRDLVRGTFGISPETRLVEPGTIPKTTSGKLQRVLCRELYLAGQL